MRKSAYGTPFVIKDGGDPIVLSKVADKRHYVNLRYPAHPLN